MTDNLNFNNRYGKIATVFSIFLVVSVIIILVFYGYRYFTISKEQKISSQVNNIIANIIDEKIFPSTEQTNKNDVNFKKLSQDLYSIYKDNPSSQNGKRALWYSCRFDFKFGDFTNSLKKIDLLTDEKSFYLSPNAFYLKALIYESLGQFEKSLKTIENFIKNYTDHYLNFNIRMAKARVLLIIDRGDEAYTEYLNLKKNNDYLSYSDLIEEKIQQVRLVNLIKKK